MRPRVGISQAACRWLALCAATLAAGVAHGERTAPIDGAWTFKYPCSGDDGAYLDRCHRGDRDVFDLALRTEHGRVCGGYVLTVQLSGRVDENDLTNWSFAAQPGGRSYRVHFEAHGSGGDARLRRSGDHLVWSLYRVEQTSLGDWPFRFVPPSRAILAKATHRTRIVCGPDSAVHYRP
jgi:hypothetical protein